MRNYIGLVAVAGLAVVPAVSIAAAPTLSDVLGSSGISAQGHVSGGYTYGWNDGQTLYGRAFDTNDNTFALNQADLSLAYLPAMGAGAMVEVLAGNDAKVINGSYGSGNGDFALTQGYLQYATGNLTLIGGRYVTLAGQEVIDDSKNANVSRSFLFALAKPLVHTGVRATYKFSDKLSANLGFANSAVSGDALDNNKPKTVESNVTFTPNATTTLAVTDYYGVDPNANEARVNYLDCVASFNLTSKLSMAFNADWAKLSNVGPVTVPPPAGVPAADVYGVAGYLTYAFTDAFKASLRGEVLRLNSGVPNTVCINKTDGKCDLDEVTATADYSVAKNFDLLGEVRYDLGDQLYPNPGGTLLSDKEGELEIKAIYKFGTPTS